MQKKLFQPGNSVQSTHLLVKILNILTKESNTKVIVARHVTQILAQKCNFFLHKNVIIKVLLGLTLNCVCTS